MPVPECCSPRRPSRFGAGAAVLAQWADVDWFLDRSSVVTASRLRREVGSYLTRHGAADRADLQAAELAVSELLANAYEHGAGPIWATLDWTGELPVFSVHDLGPDFEIDTLAPPDRMSLRGRGLWLVSQVATELRISAKRAGGKVVSVRLPVPRRDQVPSPRLRPAINPLPALGEAGPAGFGKEAFLRALTVELAATLEDRYGPQAIQDVLAQVGADVGGQLETEYRRRAGILADRLTPEQIAECCVRVKRAIGGGFFVIDVTCDRIVLGNSRCPFGPAVRHSPELCHITASVFSGIGARNAGSASVQLEERLAVGDAGCRIVMHLGADE